MLVPMAVADAASWRRSSAGSTDRVQPAVVWPSPAARSPPSRWCWLCVADGSGTTIALWLLLIPAALMGVGNRVHLVAARGHRHPQPADAPRPAPGSGVYNTTRQVGAVLGSAAIAALINARLAVELPGFETGMAREAAGSTLPAAAQSGFSAAMAQSLLLPAVVIALGVIIVAFFAKPAQTVAWGAPVQDRQPAAVAE